jgi:16S rRNA (adenine1518-N6/adenine1519-N6)-dimethyltransferase
VGNLPYYISTEILFRLAEMENVRDVHVMLQKEVVDRITASPSSKSYGRLSVTLQRRFCATPLFDVPADAFHPPPKVVSAVVALVPRRHLPAVNERTFNAIVTAAFGQRRKRLANSLRQYVSEAELQSLGVDPGLRAENLTGDDFIRVARFVGERA